MNSQPQPPSRDALMVSIIEFELVLAKVALDLAEGRVDTLAARARLDTLFREARVRLRDHASPVPSSEPDRVARPLPAARPSLELLAEQLERTILTPLRDAWRRALSEAQWPPSQFLRVQQRARADALSRAFRSYRAEAERRSPSPAMSVQLELELERLDVQLEHTLVTLAAEHTSASAPELIEGLARAHTRARATLSAWTSALRSYERAPQ